MRPRNRGEDLNKDLDLDREWALVSSQEVTSHIFPLNIINGQQQIQSLLPFP